ncbi:MAG TPA: S-layer homology domain-containing protein, partial [Clostridia bacterium]
CTITARLADGSFKDTCDVTVTAKSATRIEVKPSDITLNIGETQSLNASIYPSDTDNKQVRWSSDKDYIASVNNGKVTALQNGDAIITVSTSDGKLTAKCFVKVVAAPAKSSAPNTEAIFDDVPVDHWANGYIAAMYHAKIIKGYPDGKFYPNKLVTRAEFAKMMMLAAGKSPINNGTSSFADINANTDWCSPFVESAKYYLTGYTENGSSVFRPNMLAIREDMAVATVKLKGYQDSVYNLKTIQDMFSDYSTISDGLRKFVSIAIEKKIMNGYPEGAFKPQNGITRAEAATLLYNAFMNSGYGNKTTN